MLSVRNQSSAIATRLSFDAIQFRRGADEASQYARQSANRSLTESASTNSLQDDLKLTQPSRVPPPHRAAHPRAAMLYPIGEPEASAPGGLNNFATKASFY